MQGPLKTQFSACSIQFGVWEGAWPFKVDVVNGLTWVRIGLFTDGSYKRHCNVCLTFKKMLVCIAELKYTIVRRQSNSMADELEKTKNFMDAAVNISDVGSKVTKVVQGVSKMFTFLSVAGPAFSVLSAIFGIVGSFLPDKNHEEILAKFAILERKLDGISDEIKNLEVK